MPVIRLEESQVWPYENYRYRDKCFVNENQKEIQESFSKLREKYGSVFAASKRLKKRTKNLESFHSSISRKKSKTAKRVVEVEYNGALLPFCLETINNDMIAFLRMLGKSRLDRSVISREPQYEIFAEEMEDRLYHTSSITETVEIFQVQFRACFSIECFWRAGSKRNQQRPYWNYDSRISISASSSAPRALHSF